MVPHTVTIITGDPRMTSAAKRKGSGFEREVVEAFKEAGLSAWRVPLSGAMAEYKGDVILVLESIGYEYTIECKRRKAGFRTLYGWLGDNDFLVFRDDKCEPLIVSRLTDFAAVVKWYEVLVNGEK
jgi:hypothetical protein